MILVDSSVWVDHFRRSNDALAALLVADRVCVHAMVIGELALGSMRQRAVILQSPQDMPHAAAATDAEALGFIDRHALYSKGIGSIDAHLLASAKLSAAKLWTRDKRLQSVAEGLQLAYSAT